MRISELALLAGAAAFPLLADQIPYRAQIQGGGGDHGKCTIEVEVQGAATVEIRQDQGMLDSGGGSNWRRFQCNQVMPRNPNNFRFKGVDGHGTQQLIRQPGSNGGVAVVQITDNGHGREGYTFDIEWNGGTDGPSGYAPTGGGWGDRDWDGDRNWTGDSGWGGGDYTIDRARDACVDAVRSEARARYDLRNDDLRFDDVHSGGKDWLRGTFTSRQGDLYRFRCSVDFQSSRVRDVDIQRRDRH
jgi:hypothetical protein